MNVCLLVWYMGCREFWKSRLEEPQVPSRAVVYFVILLYLDDGLMHQVRGSPQGTCYRDGLGGHGR